MVHAQMPTKSDGEGLACDGNECFRYNQNCSNSLSLTYPFVLSQFKLVFVEIYFDKEQFKRFKTYKQTKKTFDCECM